MKQPFKKKEGTRTSGLSAWKSKNGLSVSDGENPSIKASNANKPYTWLIMPKAFQEATQLPGIPEGFVVSVMGHSNVGKTTLINHTIVAAQRQGLIPVIIDTENNFSFQYAAAMGFDAAPVYGDVTTEVVDPETGEITEGTKREIINWEGNFVYYNNVILCERFGDIDWAKGVRTKTKRKTAVVEDVAGAINELIDAQENEEICQGFLFVWDSVGSIGCFRELGTSTGGIGKMTNNMWTAGAISQSFSQIVNSRIPSSRKISSKYTNTLIYINKIWLDSSTGGQQPSVKPKGGASLGYSSRLTLLLGGKLTAGIKKLTATSKGFNYSYGIETKIRVEKNHLDAPYNTLREGNLIATDLGFIAPEDIDEYKKNHMSEILKKLNELSNGTETISENDVEFKTEEEDGASE